MRLAHARERAWDRPRIRLTPGVRLSAWRGESQKLIAFRAVEAVTTVLLARHGVTDWGCEGRRQGQADPPLNAFGRAQASALADRLGSVALAAVYASDLRRALETAHVVAAGRALPIVSMSELREADAGSWTGLTRAEVDARFPAGRLRRRRGFEGWEGGETYGDLAARVIPVVRAIAARHVGENVLVVTHDGPIRVITASAVGREPALGWRDAPRIPEGGVITVLVEAGDIRLAPISG
jgi:broad specificity phosphatase PhoE